MSEDRVLRYKVKKALEQGVRKDAEHLAAFVGRPHQRREVQRILEELYPDEFGYKMPREFATLEELVEYAKVIVQNGGWDRLEEYRTPYMSACGCMGPQDGEPLCPCGMRMALAKSFDSVIMRLADELHGQ